MIPNGPKMLPIGDDILRWVSESEEGTWAALKDAIAHCLASRSIKGLRTWMVATDLVHLGHADVDWEAGRWSAASPCLVMSPGMGMCCYAAGWRTSALLKRFNRATDHLDTFSFKVKQGHAPRALFAKVGSMNAAEELAARMEVPLVLDPSGQLADLVGLDDDVLDQSAPPPVDEVLHRYEVESLSWRHTDGSDGNGLYRFELHGQRVFRLRDGDAWYKVDRAEGQLRALQGRTDVLRWHPSSRDNAIARSFVVVGDVSLPAMAERALVAASGLLPTQGTGLRVYRNVSAEVARTISARLGLPLRVSRNPVQLGG